MCSSDLKTTDFPAPYQGDHSAGVLRLDPSSCTSSIAPAKAEPVHSRASEGETPATVFGFDGAGGGGGGASSASIAASIAFASRRNAAASARRSSDVAAAALDAPRKRGRRRLGRSEAAFMKSIAMHGDHMIFQDGFWAAQFGRGR